ISHIDEVKDIRKKAIKAGLKLVDCPIRHLGTEMAQKIYLEIQEHLINLGVEIKFDTTVKDLIIEDNRIKGVLISDALTKKIDEEIFSEKLVVATGRKGADWLGKMCKIHNIDHAAGTVDIGVRVELRNEIMEEVNEALYESKLIGYPAPFKNKVRTFCQNPGGFVSQENYDGNLAIVNGHSYKNKKSENTNLAILCSHNFSKPFNEPIEYGKMVTKLCNMLGNGKILVQRYGDILDGKRTWEHELNRSNVKNTLPDAVAGDLTSAIPYRTMTNILNFIESMDTVVPGFASKETLLYGPEIKFYSNKINIDKNFETNIKGLHCLGDSSGWTRGLMMASAMGVMMGRKIFN
ncbi:MAG: FAD-dependent oxidoreductase, partial [Clostridiaceae bacterium]|nr:FAD-dependent oxidoreductase [Clostridiaceae bacterium]